MRRLGGPVFGRRVFCGWDSCLDCLPGERVPPPGTDRHGSKGNLIGSERPKIQPRTRGCTHIQSESKVQAQTPDSKVKKSIIIRSSPAQTGGKPDRDGFVYRKALGEHRMPARDARPKPAARPDPRGDAGRRSSREHARGRTPGPGRSRTRRARRACLPSPL